MNYYCDDKGNVYNENGYKLKLNDDGNGYLFFSKMTDGKRKNMKVHRFVWEEFNGKIPQGYQIDHINNDKKDNRLDNLRIVTPKVNNRKRPCVKLNVRKVYIIRELYNRNILNTIQLAERYEVDKSLISRIINYKIWI